MLIAVAGCNCNCSHDNFDHCNLGYGRHEFCGCGSNLPCCNCGCSNNKASRARCGMTQIRRNLTGKHTVSLKAFIPDGVVVSKVMFQIFKGVFVEHEFLGDPTTGIGVIANIALSAERQWRCRIMVNDEWYSWSSPCKICERDPVFTKANVNFVEKKPCCAC